MCGAVQKPTPYSDKSYVPIRTFAGAFQRRALAEYRKCSDRKSIVATTPGGTWSGNLRRFSFAAAAFLFIMLSSCSGGGAPPETTATSPQETPAASSQIAAWGDSSTSGIGAPTDLSYPAQLQSLTGRSTFNGGVSGQTSDQIAARQGGAPALLTFPNNTLPSAGPVVLDSESTFPITAEGPGPITGTVGGVHGTLSYQTDGNDNPQLAFTRDQPGLPKPIPARSPFHPDTFGREAQINVFWTGNNFYDPQGLESDIAKCVAFLSTRRYIVLSLTNAGDEGIGTAPYDELAQINAEFAQAYPDNFIDIRRILVNSYDPTDPQDVQDHGNDIPPSSLRNDNWHLNEKGYAIVARQVADYIAARSW
jgi:lysophospholipase L1-like esterase